jgi:hypothetical protein
MTGANRRSTVPCAAYAVRLVRATDPSHELRAAAQLEALRRLLQGGEAR